MERNIDLHNASVTVYILLSYLNAIMVNQETDKYHGVGFQHIYLENTISNNDGRRSIGLGGNISSELLEALKNSPDDLTKMVEKAMYDCSLCVDGYLQHPEWEMRNNHYEYRCVMRDCGEFYLEVPGTNSCSFYLETGRNSMGCHNIDTFWQELLLLAGFAKLNSLVQV